MNVASITGVAADLATVGTGGIAVAALVISIFAWRATRRSAVADEGALALAAADAQQRATDREDAAGPTFERVSGTISKQTARMELRVVGGPGRVVIDVEADKPWCREISVKGGPPGQSLRFPPMEPGSTFDLIGHLTVTASRSDVLPLLITAESREDLPRTWKRRVPVELDYIPPPEIF